MSGTASVGNTFQSAVTATGLQLDQNYSTIVAYLNDPTNRNNYAADSGTTNTIALAFSPPVAGGYTAGLEITFKAASGNTGGVVVNANGLGNKNLFNAASAALGGGEITAGQVIKAAYDGTQFQMLSGAANNVGPASKAQMQTATSAVTFVSPAQAQNHPGVAKVVAQWTGTSTGTITVNSGFNVPTIVRGGTGTYTVVFASAFANTTYLVLSNSNSAGFTGIPLARATSGFTIVFANDAGTTADSQDCGLAVFGTLA